MKQFEGIFYQFILPNIIQGTFCIIVPIVTYFLTKGSNKLASKEITVNKNVDGSVTERKMEIYK